MATLVTIDNQEGVSYFYHVKEKNKDKSHVRARRNGKTRTWKTRPTEFMIPVKQGLRNFGYITELNCNEWMID